MKDIAKSVSKSMGGISPTILELIMAIAARKSDEIGEAVRKLGDELKIDGSLLENICDLVLSEFNPAHETDYSEIEQTIQKIFKLLAPNLPLASLVGEVCQIVIARDPTPLIRLIESQAEEYFSSTVKDDLKKLLLLIYINYIFYSSPTF